MADPTASFAPRKLRPLVKLLAAMASLAGKTVDGKALSEAVKGKLQ